jgi:GTP-binding protein EngB required for normal cell division
MWGRKVNIKESIFFQGFNIFDTLKKSLFGRVKEIINKLVENNPVELEEYKLPKVIVIGNESTGKSSLLENITKCQIFPRHNLLCTKAPIRLILNNGQPKYSIRHNNQGSPVTIEILDKRDIYKKMQEIMDKLPIDIISEDEIIVEMTDYDLPSFEFYDLPGIRSYPPAMAEITTNLCRKYLASKDSIVLCVVPATITRLTSCQSIALINEMGMMQNCILALTMCDRLQLENVEDLLIKRILLTTDELADLNFKNCIGVVNRLHTDYYSLEENDNIEMKWFQDNIIDCMPTDYVDSKEKITNNITTQKLLQQMDILYNNFIQQNWKPKILAKINTDLTNIQKQINEMGPEKITEAEINNQITTYLKTKIPDYLIDRELPNEKVTTEDAMIQMQDYHNALDKINMLINGYLVNNYDSDSFEEIIVEFFNPDSSYAYSVANKLFRFESKKNQIMSNIDSYYLQVYPQIVEQTKVIILQDLNRKCVNCIKIEADYYVKKIDEVMELFLYHDLMTKIITSDVIDHKESETYSKKRQELVQRISVLQNYRNTVNNI